MATQKKAPQKKAASPTSVSQWRNQEAPPIELPSGNFAKLRKASMEYFLLEGFIPNSLKSLVQGQISEMESTQGKKEQAKVQQEQAKELAEILNDEGKLRELIGMYDRIAAHCFLDPVVDLPPENPEERNDEVLYTDEIDMDDKVFVFNVAIGGTKDIESFRRQQSASVESVRASQAVEG